MNKFNNTFLMLMESIGSEANTYQGVYDLYMNLVLDLIQDTIKNTLGNSIDIQIEYEKTYTLLFWQNENNTSINILIDETGQIVINAKSLDELGDDKILFEKNLVLTELSILTSETFINAINNAQDAAITFK